MEEGGSRIADGASILYSPFSIFRLRDVSQPAAAARDGRRRHSHRGAPVQLPASAARGVLVAGVSARVAADHHAADAGAAVAAAGAADPGAGVPGAGVRAARRRGRRGRGAGAVPRLGGVRARQLPVDALPGCPGRVLRPGEDARRRDGREAGRRRPGVPRAHGVGRAGAACAVPQPCRVSRRPRPRRDGTGHVPAHRRPRPRRRAARRRHLRQPRNLPRLGFPARHARRLGPHAHPVRRARGAAARGRARTGQRGRHGRGGGEPHRRGRAARHARRHARQLRRRGAAGLRRGRAAGWPACGTERRDTAARSAHHRPLHLHARRARLAGRARRDGGRRVRGRQRPRLRALRARATPRARGRGHGHLGALRGPGTFARTRARAGHLRPHHDPRRAPRRHRPLGLRRRRAGRAHVARLGRNPDARGVRRGRRRCARLPVRRARRARRLPRGHRRRHARRARG